MKSFSVSGVACFLTLCLGVSAQGAYTFTPIDMPGADATWAWGIDGSNIVGEYTSGGANISHGFSYDGSTYTTRDVPGALASYAHGIDGGNIVGEYADGGGSHGFSYDGITYTTLNVPGASSTRAYGIDGGNIVGSYIDGSGRHGFLATPTPIPEPATLSLLAGGMLMVCRRR